MTFKLIGNELVGQPEMQKPESFDDWNDADSVRQLTDAELYTCNEYAKHITSLPHYTVEEKDKPHFKSKEVWEDNWFNIRYQELSSAEVGKPVEWINCSPIQYFKRQENSRRIIARPLQTITPDSGKADAVELYRGDFQAYADRLLRDRGASNADVEWAINETINELCKTYQIIKK